MPPIKSLPDSQLESGYYRLKKDWYNLYEITESEISHREMEMAENGIEIGLESYADDVPVYMDALKISQVLRNLLNNAVNRTPDSGKILPVAASRGSQRLRPI